MRPPGKTKVASATRRARHTCRVPFCVRAQCLGRRYFSSKPCAINAFPASVDFPIAAANSAMQNSATMGAPGPASVRPVSPPPTHMAASWIDSVGLLGPVTAASKTAASAASATRRCSRANDSTSAGLSSSGVLVVAVAVMDQSKQRGLTVSSRIGLFDRDLEKFFEEISEPVGDRSRLGVRLSFGSPGVVSTGARWRSLLDHHGVACPGVRSGPPGGLDGALAKKKKKNTTPHCRRTSVVRLTWCGLDGRSLTLAARPPWGRVGRRTSGFQLTQRGLHGRSLALAARPPWGCVPRRTSAARLAWCGLDGRSLMLAARPPWEAVAADQLVVACPKGPGTVLAFGQPRRGHNSTSITFVVGESRSKSGADPQP